MKRYIILLMTIIIINFNIYTYASTTTYERTEEDLKINSSIKINEKVKQATLATPKVDASEKIYDFADLLSEAEEKSLYDKVLEFINKYNLDMAIVTIDNNNKSSSEAYADDFYDYNDFGIGSTFDGLLFLIDMDERMMHINTTGQAILLYDDYRIDRILDSSYTYISDEDYYNTVYYFIQEATYFADMGIPNSNMDYEINSDGDYVKSNEYNIGVIFILSAICTGIFAAITISKHKLVKKATHAKQYLINKSIVITQRADRFLTSNTTKIYNPTSSSSSGGGSSTHRSSSGRSHGGGSRRF